MEKEDKRIGTKKARTMKPEKSKRLIGLDEFFFSCPLRREYKAALRVRLKETYHTQDEWQQIVDNFLKEIE